MLHLNPLRAVRFALISRTAFISCNKAQRFLNLQATPEAPPLCGVYSHLLRAYPSTRWIQKVHARILSEGLSRDSYYATHLVKSYAKAGNLEAARRVFEVVPDKSIFLFNALIRAYNIDGSWSEVAELYCYMEEERVEPDGFTLPFVIKAFSNLLLLEEAKRIGEMVEQLGLIDNVYVATALIDMYIKFDDIETARKVFDEMPERDVVACTSMVVGYVSFEDYKEAFRIFKEMRLGDQKPNWVTVLGLVPACDYSIHGFIMKSGFDFSVEVQTALIEMYAKCGNVESARQVFGQTPTKSLISWTAMVYAYSQNNYSHDALGVFYEMLESSELRPDSIVSVSVVQACAQLGSLNCGKMVHGYIAKSGFETELLTQTALLDMYAKCGNINAAETVFRGIKDPSLVTWSAMISGYGFNGFGIKALNIFNNMHLIGLVPDESMFLSILSACSHSGLVHEGKECFHLMLQSSTMAPGLKHYACMVDLLGRAGLVDEAWELIKMMQIEPDVNVWGALLSACRVKKRMDLAELACRKLVELDPNNTDYYVLLANLYASFSKWNEVAKVRAILRRKGEGKAPGWSLIELNCEVHAFLAENATHPGATEIYRMLDLVHNISADKEFWH